MFGVRAEKARQRDSSAKRYLALYLWIKLPNGVRQRLLDGPLQQPVKIDGVDDRLRPVVIVEKRVRL